MENEINNLMKRLNKQREAMKSVLPDGTYPLNEEYQAILELDKKLTEAGIPHTKERTRDGWIICYPSDGRKRKGDAVQYFGSLGAFNDLVEVFGFGLREPEGHLNADAAFEYFRKAHEKRGLENGNRQ